ncbi:hypothetical protein P9112_002819 [Eukaryota sp. TZLM1-RC]
MNISTLVMTLALVSVFWLAESSLVSFPNITATLHHNYLYVSSLYPNDISYLSQIDTSDSSILWSLSLPVNVSSLHNIGSSSTVLVYGTRLGVDHLIGISNNAKVLFDLEVPSFTKSFVWEAQKVFGFLTYNQNRVDFVGPSGYHVSLSLPGSPFDVYYDNKIIIIVVKNQIDQGCILEKLNQEPTCLDIEGSDGNEGISGLSISADHRRLSLDSIGNLHLLNNRKSDINVVKIDDNHVGVYADSFKVYLLSNPFTNPINLNGSVVSGSGNYLVVSSNGVGDSFHQLPFDTSQSYLFGSELCLLTLMKEKAIYFNQSSNQIIAEFPIPQWKSVKNYEPVGNCPSIILIGDDDDIIGKVDFKGLSNYVPQSNEYLILVNDNELEVISSGKVTLSIPNHIASAVHNQQSIKHYDGRLLYPVNQLLLVVSELEGHSIKVELSCLFTGKTFYSKIHSNVKVMTVLTFAGKGNFIYSFIYNNKSQRTFISLKVLSKSILSWVDVFKLSKKNFNYIDFETVSQTFTSKVNTFQIISDDLFAYFVLNNGLVYSLDFDWLNPLRLTNVPDKKAKKLPQISVYSLELPLIPNNFYNISNFFFSKDSSPLVVNSQMKTTLYFAGLSFVAVDLYPFGKPKVYSYFDLFSNQLVSSASLGLFSIAVIVFVTVKKQQK